jgi:hypothetical protein
MSGYGVFTLQPARELRIQCSDRDGFDRFSVLNRTSLETLVH